MLHKDGSAPRPYSCQNKKCTVCEPGNRLCVCKSLACLHPEDVCQGGRCFPRTGCEGCQCTAPQSSCSAPGTTCIANTCRRTATNPPETTATATITESVPSDCVGREGANNCPCRRSPHGVMPCQHTNHVCNENTSKCEIRQPCTVAQNASVAACLAAGECTTCACRGERVACLRAQFCDESESAAVTIDAQCTADECVECGRFKDPCAASWRPPFWPMMSSGSIWRPRLAPRQS